MANVTHQQPNLQPQFSEGFRKSTCSFVAGLSDPSYTPLEYTSSSSSSKGISAYTSQMKRMVMSPSDEVLLTELAIDHKDITIYDITSVICVGEVAESKPYGEFKCYMDNITKEFFLEITNKTKLESITQSALLNILDVAEKNGALTVIVCIRNSLLKDRAIVHILKSFIYIGFMQLSEEDQKIISMTRTHALLKYTV